MIRPYTSADFKQLESWVTDAALLLQFSGTDFSYPITEQQIEDYRTIHPDRCFYMGYTKENVPFAFGEIISQKGAGPRLGRILVGEPGLRGLGLGKCFIKLLVEECKRVYDCDTVELFVWDKNAAAIRCYAAVGFKYLPEKCKTLVHEGISYDIYKMVYTFGMNPY